MTRCLQTHTVTGGQGAFPPVLDDGVLLHVIQYRCIGFTQQTVIFEQPHGLLYTLFGHVRDHANDLACRQVRTLGEQCRIQGQ